ncbi:MAG: histidine kinase dimerization/phosphoacceptor domain -containing protein [Caulobacteraceae bacterium]
MSAPTPLHAEVAHSLSEALVVSSNAPLLLLDGDLKVVAASATFIRAFQVDPARVAGRHLAEFGTGEWGVPQLGSLLRATAFGHADISAYEMDLVRPGRPTLRLVMNARKLDYGSDHEIRILLTVADVTDARIAEKFKDDLLREKAILLQELQHRVANSLQIIASVLMMSARRVNSDETRRHLYDAHSRVMSVAALQRQLTVSTVGDVELKSYFKELCESISASMINDPRQLILEVEADGSSASADVSVSLGLIVTELVINALKHAFPGGRPGRIAVSYHSGVTDWTLGVDDNGVGMPVDRASSPPGLGSSIVAALAKHLDAEIKIGKSDPGTSVTLVHRVIAEPAGRPARPVELAI